MRKILLTMMALIISIEASAEPISRQQAQQRAAAFLKQQNPQATLATTAVANAPRKVKGQTIEDQSYYYVFNTENNHGFVIASGDDDWYTQWLSEVKTFERAWSEDLSIEFPSVPSGDPKTVARELYDKWCALSGK